MKRKLRRKYLDVRKNILNKNIKDNIIFNKVINDQDIFESSDILIYVSLDDEVDTRGLINYFLELGKNVYVPRVFNKDMEFYRIRGFEDLRVGYKNILEPVGIQKIVNFDKAICITPGVCYNDKGYRIGYGGGFYDKFLSRNKVFSIGLCYRECLTDEEFNEKLDVFIDKIITD